MMNLIEEKLVNNRGCAIFKTVAGIEIFPRTLVSLHGILIKFVCKVITQNPSTTVTKISSFSCYCFPALYIGFGLLWPSVFPKEPLLKIVIMWQNLCVHDEIKTKPF